MPSRDKTVPERASAEAFGPVIIAHQIDRAGLDGGVAIGADDRMVEARRGQRLGARDEARADQHAVRPEHQRRGQRAAVGNAARGHQQRVGRRLRQIVGDFAHQREGAAVAAVPACLAALCDDHRSAGIDRFSRMDHRLHLADHRHARLPDLGGETGDRSEREHDRRGPARQYLIEQLRALRQRPRNEAAADARISGRRKFALQPAAVAVATADQPEPAGIRHRGRQPAAGDHAHRRGDDRMFDLKPFGQAGAQSHGYLLKYHL